MKASSPVRAAWQRWRGRIVLALVLLAVVAILWKMASNQVGVRRSAPRIATITPLPPPPPPPKVRPPEPKKTEEVHQDIPKPNVPVPKPVASPQPAPDTPRQVTINGPAQAGNDAFNIGAGSGGGQVGSGGGNGVGGSSYEQYLGYALQQAIQSDDRARRLTFDVQARLWINAGGTIERIELVVSSGSRSTDEALEHALRGLHIDTPPPPALSMPVRVAMHGRRPG